MKKYLFLLLVLTIIKADVEDVTVPNDFTAGTRAVAADVNENFDSLETGVNRINDTIAKAYVKKLDYRSDGDSSFASIRVDSLTDYLYVDSLKVGTAIDLGAVTTIDINGGTIDGVTIGGAAAPTVTDLGSVTTCDINGGAIDGVPIGAASASTGAFTTLSTSGLVTVNDTIIASGASGVYMLEDGGSGIVVENGGNVGIGSGVDPSSVLDVRKDQNGATNLTIQNQTAGNSAWAGITMQAASAYGRIVTYDDGYSDAEYADKTVLYANTTAAALALMTNTNTEFYTGGYTSGDKVMVLSPTELDLDTDSLNVAGLVVGDTIIADDATGLYLLEDGNSGIYVEDGGNVGIGSGIDPFYLFDVMKDQNDATVSRVTNQTAGTGALARYLLQSESNWVRMTAFDDGNSNAEMADKGVIEAGASAALALMSNANIEFYIGGTGAANKEMVLSPTELDLDTDSLNVAGLIVCDTLSGDITVTGTLDAPTLNTGQGDNELYDMDQNVLTTSAPTFATIETGQGANELYDMDQNVQTTDAVQFSSANVDTIRDGAGNDNLLLSTDNFTSPFDKIGFGKTSLEGWAADNTVLQLGGTNSIRGLAAESAGSYFVLSNNIYYDGSSKRFVNDECSYMVLQAGGFEFYGDAADVADQAFSPTLKMSLSTTKLDVDVDTLVADTAQITHLNMPLTIDTISSGVIEFKGSHMSIWTEGGAALDTITDITGGSEGDMLILRTVDDSHDIFVRDLDGPLMEGSFTIDNDADRIMFINDDIPNFCEISRSNND